MLTQDIIGLIMVYSIIATSLCISIHLHNKGSKIDSRKITHIGVGNFIFVWWMFSQGWIMLAFFAIPFAIILFIVMIGNNPLSKTELGDISNNLGHRSGLFLYVVSIMILILFFFDHWLAATLGIVAMTYGDGSGSIFGRRFGKHKTINGKSLEGSMGVFLMTSLVSGIIILFYTFLSNDVSWAHTDTVTATIPMWCVCLLSGVLTAIVETICPGNSDNLVIPISVALLCVTLGL